METFLWCSLDLSTRPERNSARNGLEFRHRPRQGFGWAKCSIRQSGKANEKSYVPLPKLSRLPSAFRP